MRKIINAPEDFVDEVIDGLLLAHPGRLAPVGADRRALVGPNAGRKGRVGIVTGGGSGHLPLFLGYVGEGLASGVAVGNVFSSPSPAQIHAATLASDGGAGVLYLYGNYGGDIYNFDIAADLSAADGVRTATVLGADDVTSAPKEKAETRRGVAGLFFAYKTAGAAADRGDDLDTVAAIAQRTCDRVRTMGVGLSPTILPAAGEPTFTLDEGEMEIGIGIHGEPGVHRGALESADEITDRFLAEILPELDLPEGSEVAVLVNGLGATPLEELYLIYRHAHGVLAERGITIRQVYIGEYATSLEMAGASLSVLALDDELAELLDAPAHSPFYQHAAGGLGEADDREDAPATGSTAPGEVAAREIATVANPGPLYRVARAVLAKLPSHAEELRERDAALGDGDLGITVSSGAKAAEGALQDLPEDAAPREIFSAIGAAFAAANPSTFAALIGGGLLAAAQSLDESDDISTESLARALRAMTDRVMERGGAEAGDKTVVDSLLALADQLGSEAADAPALEVADRAVEAAGGVVERDAERVSQRGRAAWVGERSAGHPDPGQVAFHRLTQTIAEVLRTQ